VVAALCRISVDTGAPIKPDGDDFAAVVRLRDAARSFLLAHCHAPDLVQEKVDLGAWAQLSNAGVCDWLVSCLAIAAQ
jgi:hypothetical protein